MRKPTTTSPIHSIPVQRADGAETTLEAHAGRVLLIVNVASRCGFTSQYDGLEALYAKYKERGFTVLGFPANDFGAQEPGSDEEIQRFCRLNYGVTFPVFAKISVKGEGRHPLFAHLTDASPKAKEKAGGPTLRQRLAARGLLRDESEVAWNFEKFLVSRSGEVVERFASDLAPDDPLVVAAIEAELAVR